MKRETRRKTRKQKCFLFYFFFLTSKSKTDSFGPSRILWICPFHLFQIYILWTAISEEPNKKWEKPFFRSLDFFCFSFFYWFFWFHSSVLLISYVWSLFFPVFFSFFVSFSFVLRFSFSLLFFIPLLTYTQSRNRHHKNELLSIVTYQ